MSQVTLLGEVSQWNQETCQQELKTVLPKLVAMHHDTESWEDHTNILQIITSKFLPHLSLSESETGCFSTVLPKVVKVFASLLEEISKQIGGLSSQNTELHVFLRNILKMMVQILESLSGCVRHVNSFEESVSFDTIRSLPSCILRILKDTFQHCKDSEVMYSGRLSLVGDLLQGLFKEAYSLQKGLMELLDKINLEDTASEEDVSDIVTVIHSLLDICSIISRLDIALHANTWKCIIKQSVKYQSLVEDQLHHTDIAASLCEDLCTSVQNCLELAHQIQQTGLQEVVHCPEYRLFQKATKMCRFFANTLVHYTKEFKAFLTKSCCRFHQLYLQIHSKFPPSVCAPSVPPALSEELRVAVLVPMDAMLTQLMSFQPFAESVLNPDHQSSTELCLPQCLLLVNVLGKLSSQPGEALRLWSDGSQFSEETPRWSVFEAVLQSFRQCMLERALPVWLPGVMLRGQAQGRVSLHKHVCVHMCACVGVLPAQHFPPLERSLLAAVLQADTQTAVLATDVWCFLARYGTAELCFHHVLLIAHMIRSCPGEGYQLFHLALLLRRLLFLMTPRHQVEFVERFPPSQEENLCVWRHILLRCLCVEARIQVEKEVLAMASVVLQEWQNSGHRLGDIPRLNRILGCVLLVIGGSSLQAECVLSSVKIISQLWSHMSSNQVQDHPPLQCTVKLLLSLSAFLIKSLEPQVIVQAVSCLNGLPIQKCSDDLLLAALEFLASTGKCQVLPRISDLFNGLLTHPSWLILHHVLEAFGGFAEITNHEEVISQTLTSEEVKTKVLNFLSKTVSQLESGEVRLERLKEWRSIIEKHCEQMERENSSSVHTPLTEEPCPKKPRQETNTEEEYERYLQTAENALKALQAIEGPGHSPSPPVWVKDRLQVLQTLITQINTTAEQQL
ncbi:FIGNL1-interacting regulator of recombination and mitosis isoform X2 [Pseudorasbora parva]|uniref:FIGNL1-interacting regulator of recombination and mitosis isoform X2 n=1 Tax=Pseudorasbora parva TaxID=51549 RepID=UPI00351E6A5B